MADAPLWTIVDRIWLTVVIADLILTGASTLLDWPRLMGAALALSTIAILLWPRNRIREANDRVGTDD
jgi:hypothetical protein